jgi:hypothetical protein
VTRKTISTNGPVVACDVCGRTLLRGEHGDVFLHGGVRRTVCDLCTPRAAHEGWIREGLDNATVRAGTERAKRSRSRSLLGRLRHRRSDAAPLSPQDRRGGPEPDVSAHEGTHEPPPAARPAPPPPPPREPLAPPREPRNVHAVPTNADLKMARALDLFNSSAHRRTVAGVGRSLGAPIVAVRPSASEGSVVTIAVAWELSWYRFEVDLADEAAGVRLADQGTELDELGAAEHVPNAAADDEGELHLVAQHA